MRQKAKDRRKRWSTGKRVPREQWSVATLLLERSQRRPYQYNRNLQDGGFASWNEVSSDTSTEASYFEDAIASQALVLPPPRHTFFSGETGAGGSRDLQDVYPMRLFCYHFVRGVVVGRDKGVIRAKVPHIPTPYVCGTMAIATMRTHTYGARCAPISYSKAHVRIQS